VTFTNTSSSAQDVQFDVTAANGPHCGEIATTILCSHEIDEARRSFILAGSGCHPVPAGGACTVSIVFEPQGPFKLTASLEYRLANLYIDDVDLEGIGVPGCRIPLPATVRWERRRFIGSTTIARMPTTGTRPMPRSDWP
jgi:hypothetical protein